MKVFSFITFVATIVTIVISKPENSTKSRLTILKCCRHGEALRQKLDANDPDSLLHCEKTTNEWKPIIYAPVMQSWVLELPSYWDILDGRKPECDEQSELTYEPYNINSPFLFLENGNVIIDGFNTLNLDGDVTPSDYCADSNGLLICKLKNVTSNHAAATMRPRVRRCCGENAAFYEEK